MGETLVTSPERVQGRELIICNRTPSTPPNDQWWSYHECMRLSNQFIRPKLLYGTTLDELQKGVSYGESITPVGSVVNRSCRDIIDEWIIWCRYHTMTEWMLYPSEQWNGDGSIARRHIPTPMTKTLCWGTAVPGSDTEYTMTYFDGCKETEDDRLLDWYVADVVDHDDGTLQQEILQQTSRDLMMVLSIMDQREKMVSLVEILDH